MTAEWLPDAAEGSFPRDLLERVVGADERTLVPNVTEPPWRFNCSLLIRARTGKRFVGTGWFISPRTLATAGHCVYMHDEGGWAESIDVIPARDGNTRPFGIATARTFKSVAGWTSKRNDDFDYGAIVLDTDVFRNVGVFAFAALPDRLLEEALVNISGYPADRDGAARQYVHARAISHVNDRNLFYEVDTYGGQSGSATWITVSAQEAAAIGIAIPAGAKTVRLAVGIHTKGAFLGNSATRITRDVATNLRMWMV